MHKILVHTRKNTTFQYFKTISETIYTETSSILPCENFELSKIRHQDLLKSISQ